MYRCNIFDMIFSVSSHFKGAPSIGINFKFQRVVFSEIGFPFRILFNSKSKPDTSFCYIFDPFLAINNKVYLSANLRIKKKQQITHRILDYLPNSAENEKNAHTHTYKLKLKRFPINRFGFRFINYLFLNRDYLK